MFYLQGFNPLFTGCFRSFSGQQLACGLGTRSHACSLAAAGSCMQQVCATGVRIRPHRLSRCCCFLAAWQRRASVGPGHPVALCRSIHAAVAQPRTGRGAPHNPPSAKGLQFWKGPGGSCWARARHRQESGCRLSHRRLFAPNEQYWPSASLPLAHPSPHRHRALAAAPCPAAQSWHPPCRSGTRRGRARGQGLGCTLGAAPIVLCRFATGESCTGVPVPQICHPQRRSAHSRRGAPADKAPGTGWARCHRGGSVGTVDQNDAARGAMQIAAGSPSCRLGAWQENCLFCWSNISANFLISLRPARQR